MNAGDILNADLADVGRWLAEGFAWWIEELAGLLPATWRASFAPAPAILAEYVGGQAGYRFWRDGKLIDLADPAKAKVGLLLGPGETLMRRIKLPLLPLRDVRRTLALDVDRLTPFRPEAAYLAVEILSRDAEAGHQEVLLGIWPKAEAAMALERAHAHGLVPSAIKVRGQEAADPPRLDFLPCFAGKNGAAAAARRRLWWWSAVGVLMAANLGALVARDMIDVARLRATLDSQRETVALAERVRKRLQDESKARTDLLARRAAGEPLRAIDAVTAVLPQGDWVQHLEWNGRAIRLVGYRQPNFDIAGAMRSSPAFANPRLLSTETPAKVGSEPFDLFADARATR